MMNERSGAVEAAFDTSEIIKEKVSSTDARSVARESFADERPAVSYTTCRDSGIRRALAHPGVRGVSLPVLVIAVWQWITSTGWLPETLLPSPTDILSSFGQLAASGELFADLEVSLMRAAVGFVVGGGLGLLLGVVAGLWRWAEEFIDPSIQTIRTVPHLAITPLFILWFGLGETSKILLIALGAFFPLYINTFMGIRGVDKKLFDVVRVLDFSRGQQLARLVLPAALPNILLGLRLSLGVAWLSLIVAELMGSSAGVGYLIENATQFSQTSFVIVGIVIFAIVGKLSDSLVRLLERRLLKWRDTYAG